MPTGAELATAWVRLVPSADGIQGDLTKELGGPVEAAADKSGKAAGKKFSTGFKASMTILSGAVIATVGKALGSSLNAASDLSEAGTAVGEIFGASFGDIDKWAAGAAGSLGQSHLEALNAAKSFGVFGSAAGLTNEENAKFSTGLAELASDFASFHNVSPQEAIEAIGSGLRGEAEPLRKFGVLMDDASLKAKAMEMGIYDGNGTLTQQQKILAANALITEQAGAAQGDFARTSDSLANKQRILDASMQNLSASVGTALIPIMSSLLDVAKPIVAWMTENPAIVQAVAIALGILAIAIGVATAAMWAMSLTPIVALIMLIVAGIALLIAGIVLLVLNWDAVVAWITVIWEGFVAWIVAVTNGFVEWWNSLWAGFGAWVSEVWNGFVSWIISVWNGFIGWIMGVLNGFVGWWNGIWTAVGNWFRDAWNLLVASGRLAWQLFQSWIQGVINGFVSWWGSIWRGVGKAINDVFSGIGSFIGGIWDGIISGIRGAVNTIIGIVNGLIDGINALIGGAGSLIGLSISIPNIPMLAKGGTITRSGATIVGENGPELLNLPRGAQVNPNYDDIAGSGGVTFVNYAPLGQTPAQALTQFKNRAEVFA